MSMQQQKVRTARRRVEEADIFWFAGMSCEGCSIAATGSESPALVNLQRGAVPGLPRVRLHHTLFAMESGHEFLADLRRAVDDELDRPYIIVLEGSATDEELAGDGYWSALGSGGLKGPLDVIDGVRQPVPTMEWIRALAPGAAAALALGTCAAWGGVPASYGNVTGAMSLADLLGSCYRSELGLGVINLPGCAPNGDNIMETLTALLLHIQGVGPVPEMDELGRPAWLFTETAHRSCVRAGYYEEGAFAQRPGDRECLVELGCWGAVVDCNMGSRGAINGLGGCMSAGGACIGCTMPGFPEEFMPFHQTEAGAALGEVPAAERSGLRRLTLTPAAGSPAGRREPDGGTGPQAMPVYDEALPLYERWRSLPDVEHG